MSKVEVISRLSVLTGSLFAIFLSLQVNAKTIFYCETKSGKQVEVQLVADLVLYRFGTKLYDPEIELLVPKEKASTFQWLGIGMNEYYDVTIPNNGIQYKVFTSRERGPEGKFENGISVWSKGKPVADIHCRNDSVYETLFGVELPKE